jgi:hypothetical protein
MPIDGTSEFGFLPPLVDNIELCFLHLTVKSMLGTICRHIEGVEIHHYSFLTSSLDGGECFSLTPLYVLRPGEEPRHPANKRLGSKSLGGRFVEDEQLLLLARFEPRSSIP